MVASPLQLLQHLDLSSVRHSMHSRLGAPPPANTMRPTTTTSAAAARRRRHHVTSYRIWRQIGTVQRPPLHALAPRENKHAHATDLRGSPISLIYAYVRVCTHLHVAERHRVIALTLEREEQPAQVRGAVHACVCMHACMYACVCVCVYVCVNACMYACMHDASMHACDMRMHAW